LNILIRQFDVVTSMSGNDKKTEKKRPPEKRERTKTSRAAAAKKPLELTAPAALPAPAVETALPQKQETIKTPEKTEDFRGLFSGNATMPLADHLHEFRGRLLSILVMLVVFTIVGFYFSDYLIKAITDPFVKSGHKLHIFTLVGGFMLKIKASFGCGVIIGFPFIVFQIWRFVAPAVPKENRTFIRLSIIAGILLFYLGIAFVYFLLMPVAVTVLLDFIGKDMTGAIGADNYLSFIIIFSVGMGVLFEFPIATMIMTKMGLVTPRFLTQYRRHAIVIIWVIAALVTPTPDPINLSIVSFALMGFYELAVIGSKMIYRKKA